jgi:prepilin-type N-terminal cleavage/methylation domain-containing protein
VRHRRGFSMVEIIVTLAVLLTIAGMLASSSTNSVRDTMGRAGKVSLDAVLVAQQTWASANGSYTADPSQLFTLANDLGVLPGEPERFGQVGMSVGSGGSLALTSRASGESCHVLTAAPWPQLLIDRFESESCAPSTHLPAGEIAVLP